MKLTKSQAQIYRYLCSIAFRDGEDILSKTTSKQTSILCSINERTARSCLKELCHKNFIKKTLSLRGNGGYSLYRIIPGNFQIGSEIGSNETQIGSQIGPQIGSDIENVLFEEVIHRVKKMENEENTKKVVDKGLTNGHYGGTLRGGLYPEVVLFTKQQSELAFKKEKKQVGFECKHISPKGAKRTSGMYEALKGAQLTSEQGERLLREGDIHSLVSSNYNPDRLVTDFFSAARANCRCMAKVAVGQEKPLVQPVPIQTTSLILFNQNPENQNLCPAAVNTQSTQTSDCGDDYAMSFSVKNDDKFYLTYNDIAALKSRIKQIGLDDVVDVDGELKRMQLWLVANKDRQKTKRGMPRFINSWLVRASGFNNESYARFQSKANNNQQPVVVQPKKSSYEPEEEEDTVESLCREFYDPKSEGGFPEHFEMLSRGCYPDWYDEIAALCKKWKDENRRKGGRR